MKDFEEKLRDLVWSLIEEKVTAEVVKKIDDIAKFAEAVEIALPHRRQPLVAFAPLLELIGGLAARKARRSARLE